MVVFLQFKKKKWEIAVNNDTTFGTKPNTGVLTDEDINKIRAYIHSVEDIAWEPRIKNCKLVQQIVYWLLGVSFCLRGRDEHHSLLWSQVNFGKYGSNGPPGMEGVPYCNLVNLTDKTHKIDIGESFFFEKKLTSKLTSCFV